MTTTTATLIRLPAGVIRVLRLVTVGTHIYPLAYQVHPDEDMCTYCGCTNVFGCVSGCSWVDTQHTMCSRCLKEGMLP